MKRTIPAREEVFCDACGRKCGEWPDAARKMKGEVVIRRAVADPNGHQRFDLCDDCLEKVRAVISAETERIRRDNPKKGVTIKMKAELTQASPIFSKTRKDMKKLYETGKLHTVVVSNYAVFDGWTTPEFEPVLGDNREKFKAMWGKPDFYFRGEHYFHVWVREFKGERFLVMTARTHGTVVEMARPDYRDIDGKRDVVAAFAKSLLKEMHLAKLA